MMYYCIARLQPAADLILSVSFLTTCVNTGLWRHKSRSGLLRDYSSGKRKVEVLHYGSWRVSNAM